MKVSPRNSARKPTASTSAATRAGPNQRGGLPRSVLQQDAAAAPQLGFMPGSIGRPPRCLSAKSQRCGRSADLWRSDRRGGARGEDGVVGEARVVVGMIEGVMQAAALGATAGALHHQVGEE